MSTFLATAIFSPLGARTNAAQLQINVQVYDREHRDYRAWDRREADSCQQYRKEFPKLKVNFSRTSRKQHRILEVAPQPS